MLTGAILHNMFFYFWDFKNFVLQILLYFYFGNIMNPEHLIVMQYFYSVVLD